MSIDAKLSQEAKAPYPIEVTLLGIVTDAKCTRYPKAISPILVTLYSTPLYVTDSGILAITILLSVSYTLTVLSAIILYLMLSIQNVICPIPSQVIFEKLLAQDEF